MKLSTVLKRGFNSKLVFKFSFLNLYSILIRKPINITLACFVAILIIQFLFGIINDTFLHISTQNPIDKFSFKEKMIIGVIVAPIIETFIFQYLSFKLIKLVTKNPIYTIGLASLFFAVNHYYNWFYILVIFFIGIILNYNYYAVQKISKYAFLLTFLLHATNNFLALLGS